MQKGSLEALRIERPVEEAPARRWPWLVALLLLLLLLGGGVAAWLLRPGTVPVRTVLVQAAPAGSGSRTVLNASGYVTARRQATVSSKATAKVMEVLIEEGMKVEAGQVLARLDTSNVEASLRLSEAELKAARVAMEETRALLERAEAELKRVKELATQRIASASDLDRAEADARSLRARLELQQQQAVVAERQMALWQQEMEDRVVRAPFAGVVVSKDAQPGEMISPVSAGGGYIRTGIGTLVDMASLEIEVDVNESFINRVEPDQGVVARLDAYPDWDIPAKVVAIIPTADRQKATVKVRIGFEQLDPRILPDMGVKVAFRDGGEAATGGGSELRVPLSAVRQVDGREVVWVVRDGRVEQRAVKLGAGGGTAEAVVLAGLREGERVVVSATGELRDGAAVREMKP